MELWKNSMTESEVFLCFLQNAHILASIVREILEEQCLRQATDSELSFSQFYLLRLVEFHRDHQVCAFASLMGISQSAVSKKVDKLVRLGFIERQIHQNDRRAFTLNLTTRGRRSIREYETLKEEKLGEALCGLPLEELNALARGLEKVSYFMLGKTPLPNRDLPSNSLKITSPEQLIAFL